MPTIGRSDILAALGALLEPDGPRVAYVHGVGGVGKTTVLRALCASRPDVRFTWLEGDAVPATLAEGAASDPVVWIVDGMDDVPRRAELLRRQLLGRFGAKGRLIVGSRRAPDVRWRTDLAPGRFLDLPLGGLDPLSASRLLERWEVPESLRAPIVERCHGHPLLLVLAAQLADPAAFADLGLEASPALASALVTALDAVPRDPVTFEAIVACAVARRTTEPLLREVLAVDDARPMFDALRRRAWVAFDRDGLCPVDVARDAIVAEARWRDPECLERVTRAVEASAVQGVRQRGAGALSDVVFLLAGASARVPAGPTTIQPTADLVAVWRELEPLVGESAMGWVGDWVGRGACALYTVDGGRDEPAGALCVLDERVLCATEPTGDPVVAAARRLVGGLGLRPGTPVRFARASGGPTTGAARLACAALTLALDAESLGAMGSVLHPPERWRPVLERHRALFTEVDDGARRVLVHLHDLRLLDVPEWLEQRLRPPGATPPEPVVLGREPFEAAVREVLRALARSRPQDLATCRLARAPLVLRVATDLSAEGRAEALRAVALEALGEAGEGDLRVSAVLHRTYVCPAAKQHAVAVDLGMSFATYRRALGRGVAATIEALWRRETRGAIGPRSVSKE